jgi:hypothetical protein
MQRSKFRYQRSVKIVQWGYSFDSLTELKFATSILEEWSFMRGRVSIYYHPGTLQPTDYVRECHRRYTPDFLIRNKETGEAFLIEIKPRAFQSDPQLEYRKRIPENYIRWKGYDWKFKVVYDDEIILDAEQLENFKDCSRLKSKSSFKLWFQQYNSRFDQSAPTMFSPQLSGKEIEFIMFGRRGRQGNLFSKEDS